MGWRSRWWGWVSRSRPAGSVPPRDPSQPRRPPCRVSRAVARAPLDGRCSRSPEGRESCPPVVASATFVRQGTSSGSPPLTRIPYVPRALRRLDSEERSRSPDIWTRKASGIARTTTFRDHRVPAVGLVAAAVCSAAGDEPPQPAHDSPQRRAGRLHGFLGPARAGGRPHRLLDGTGSGRHRSASVPSPATHMTRYGWKPICSLKNRRPSVPEAWRLYIA